MCKCIVDCIMYLNCEDNWCQRRMWRLNFAVTKKYLYAKRKTPLFDLGSRWNDLWKQKGLFSLFWTKTCPYHPRILCLHLVIFSLQRLFFVSNTLILVSMLNMLKPPVITVSWIDKRISQSYVTQSIHSMYCYLYKL